METESKIAARDKLVSKACTWLDRRKAKVGLAGTLLNTAQSKFRTSEHELAEATEKYEKAEAAEKLQKEK